MYNLHCILLYSISVEASAAEPDPEPFSRVGSDILSIKICILYILQIYNLQWSICLNLHRHLLKSTLKCFKSLAVFSPILYT